MAMSDPNSSRMGGLGGLVNQHSFDLGIPAIGYLTGAMSGAQASATALGNVLISRIMGPLAGMSYVVYGIVSAFKDWAKAAELVDRAMAAAQQKNMLVKQLAETTKSVAIAKEKVKDLYNFASKSPFSLEGVVKGGEALAKFDNGTLLTKKNLQLVGDAAAASGQRFETTADAVGQLYSDLAKNQPITESANQLKEMGVISQSTIVQIEALQSTGASLTSTWDLVTKSLEKSKGAMSGLTETLADLQQKHDDQKTAVLEPAGQVANKDAMLAQKAQNDLFEAAAPTLTNLATILTRVGDSYEYVSSKVTELVASIPGLSSIIGILTGAFSALTLAIAAVFTTNILTGVARFTVLANGAAEATGILKLAMMGLAAVGVEVAEGTTAVGLAMLGLKAVGTLLYTEMWLPLITVMGSVTGAVGGVVVALAYMYNRMETGIEAVQSYKEATDAFSDSLQKQIENMQNAGDQAAAYQKAVEEVKAAQDDLAVANAQNPWDILGLDNTPAKIVAARERIIKAQAAVSEIVNRKGLAESDAQSSALLERQKQAQQGQMQMELDTASPEQRVEILKQRQEAAQREFLAKKAAEAKLGDPTLSAQAKVDIMKASGSQELGITAGILQNGLDVQKNNDLQAKIDDIKAQILRGPVYTGLGKSRVLTNKRADEAYARLPAQLQALTAQQQGDGVVAPLTPQELQDKQHQLALIQDKNANAPSQYDVDKAGRELAIRQTQTGFQQQQANIQAAEVGATPEKQLELAKQEAEVKKQQLDYQVQTKQIAQEEANVQKTGIDSQIAAQELAAQQQAAQIEAQMKLNAVKQQSLELDQAAVGAAKDQWGALQDQVDAIEARTDLTRQQKDEQEQSLKISQEQAASDLYRAQQADKANALRLQAQVAQLGGRSGVARRLNAQAENVEEDSKEAQARQDRYEQYRAAGKTDAEATSLSTSDAHQQRQQDLAAKALQSISQISGPVADSLQRVGGGGGVETSNPLLNVSQQQLDALKAIQKSLETKPQPKAY